MDNITFTLDNKKLTARPSETLWEAAKREGIEIPHLCHRPGYRPDGNCRACVVEIQGERVLAPSCCRTPREGMVVTSNQGRARQAQKMVLELLVAEVPVDGDHLELSHWMETMGVTSSRFAPRQQPPADLSHPAMDVRLESCIQCGRCVRACREEQHNDVIGYAGSGAHAHIVFDLDDPMGASTCVACGECVQACPTGALSPKLAAKTPTIIPLAELATREQKTHAERKVAEEQVASLCPFCGVGCQVTYHVADGRIHKVEGRDGPANHSRLCVKGRFGYDYIHHGDRLMKPLMRRSGAAKESVDITNWRDVFQEVSWETAMAAAAEGLKNLKKTYGKNALAGFGSAKGSNEEAYLFQKLVRTGFGNNNVDHCTRLCHASSVAALLEGIGSGAVSNPVRDIIDAEVAIVIGANPTANHPVAATWIKAAAQKNTHLIVADPRINGLAPFAKHYLQFKPDMDVALLGGMLYTLFDEDLLNHDFIEKRVENFAAFRENIVAFSPEAMAPLCGIPAKTIREVARLYAKAKSAMIFWGMGISQHIHGTDNARCLIALAVLTGQIGRRGTGLHPLRGQNNVQGASDAGLIPMMYPDYQRVNNPQAQRFFEERWQCELSPTPGLTVVEILKAASAKTIRGMYIMGENPAMSDPDLGHSRASLAGLDFLVVQDLFLTETAALADVVLPASALPEKDGSCSNTDRLVQRVRRALPPPGEAREDWRILQEMGRRFGLPWNYAGPGDIFEEMRSVMPSIKGISWKRLGEESAVTYPCESEDKPGNEVIFTKTFPTPSSRAKLVPVTLVHAEERPDTQYPLAMITGRLLEHWHTGAMTRRSRVLNELEPVAEISISPQDMKRYRLQEASAVTISSRRGSIVARAVTSDDLPAGTVFLPFCFQEAAANILTHSALDPFGKIPEFKYSAVRLTSGGVLTPSPFERAVVA